MNTELIQRKYPDNSIVSAITKLDDTIVNLNIDFILRDIDTLDESYKKCKNSYNKKNIKALSEYLRELVKSLRNDTSLELSWAIDRRTGFPKSYPITLICEDSYGINTCNYIELDKQTKLVDINLQSLADAIAFEIMWRDLEETHDSIEEALKDCGVTTVEDMSILTDYIKEVSGNPLYQLSKSYRFSDSPYYLRDEKLLQDYFCTKTFKPTTYEEVVRHSCKTASCIILNNIIKEANRNRANIRLLLVDSTRIQFEIRDLKDKFIREVVIGDIIIRILGRKFKLNNHIKIY